MTAASRLRAGEPAEIAELVRVRGIVQGVGFRPTVWRLARELGLRGSVANDGEGVLIHACGSSAALAAFVATLPGRAPPLARIAAIERETAASLPQETDFRIVAGRPGKVQTAVAPDAATCPACFAEIFDSNSRRFRYPFTNCTHCGPRLSIVESIPYDRATTTMAKFDLCVACASEYGDPGDRRFHAQPIACAACGPRVWLQSTDGTPTEPSSALDDIDAACTLLQRGYIVAVKGLGGFQLACDAANAAAVAFLRARKQRERKPFALMARDLHVVRRYCRVSETEAALLQSPEAPIVILDRRESARVAQAVAPGIATLGFMLPNTPLHHLLMRRMERPIVLTSGNLSDEPQCVANADAMLRLGAIAEYFLMHNRDIARRVDDSVLRVMAGAAQVLRRARGYAPAPIALPEGFAAAPAVLAMGAELKNSFCLLRDGQAIVSHHIGDLADARCHQDYLQCIEKYRQLFSHDARMIAVDLHPEYLSTKAGKAIAEEQGLACVGVQHHHAHLAACMAENGIALSTSPVIGVALDGIGYGADGSLWGGEFFSVDYRACNRLASFRPVAMPGGEQAIREPWRNTYAHLMDAIGWQGFARSCGELELYRFLAEKPRDLIDGMIAKGVNSPHASSCGRLFDAVAAATGICRESALYEGQAAVEFEALVDADVLARENAYPFSSSSIGANGLYEIGTLAMWQALLADLVLGTPVPVVAARFHKGLAIVVVRMVEFLGERIATRTAALSGGVFQNRVLLEEVVSRLASKGFTVLTHHLVPANDGGLALGQGVVAAARSLSH